MKQDRDEWRVEFRPNVHMYCHELVASRLNRHFTVPCEDTPEGFVGIWPYDLGIDDGDYDGLIQALHQWAETLDFPYRLYVTRDRYETGTTG